jgi:hypothetical protein
VRGSASLCTWAMASISFANSGSVIHDDSFPSAIQRSRSFSRISCRSGSTSACNERSHSAASSHGSMVVIASSPVAQIQQGPRSFVPAIGEPYCRTGWRRHGIYIPSKFWHAFLKFKMHGHSRPMVRTPCHLAPLLRGFFLDSRRHSNRFTTASCRAPR